MEEYEILEWFENYTNTYVTRNDFIIEDNGITYLKSLSIDGNFKELPFKFNIIKGDFHINNYFLESFNNFPNIIEGSCVILEHKVQDPNTWDVKVVKESIQVNSPEGKPSENKVENLNYLYKTEFQKVYLEDYSNFFKNNKIPNEYRKYIQEEVIGYSDFQELKRLQIITNESVKLSDIDDYLGSFNDLSTELEDL